MCTPRSSEDASGSFGEQGDRHLSGKHYVYIWADGIHANARLEAAENNGQCLLVLMGTLPDGNTELIAVLDGYRDSKHSWYEPLVDLKQEGLTMTPEVAIGDAALGSCAALLEVYPATREQRW